MHSRNLFAVPALILLLSMCTPPPYDPPAPQLTAGALSDAYGTATAEAIIRTPVPSPTATVTVTLTPCCGVGPITVTPQPSTTPVDGIIEFTTQDVEWLAATCWIETRGMGDKKEWACVAVISTIMWRTTTRTYSDGTIRGTLTYNCTPESETCAFPAWAVNGCDGIIPQVCPFYDTEAMIEYQRIVLAYTIGYDGIQNTPCRYRAYYGSRLGIDDKDGACIIKSDNGQWIGFYN